MTSRILGYIIVFLSILILPYWIYLPILLVTIIVFPFFWEGLVFAMIIDAIYGRGAGFTSTLISPVTLAALAVLIILIPFQKSLRPYV